MFEKILSIMPYNPSLVHQMRFYGRRMQEEASIRRIGIVFIILAFAVQFFAVLNPPQTTSAAACSDNDVIRCGAYTTADVKSNYDNNPSVQTIYHYFGIDHNEIDNLHLTAVTGKVTQGGRVLDQNDHEIATDVITAGRQDIPGSTRVDREGTGGHVTFYTRPPSVSFQSSSLEAFVVKKDGVFQFAILKSCGNPVMPTGQVGVLIPGGGTTPVTPPPVGTPTISLSCDRLAGNVPDGKGKYFRIFFDPEGDNIINDGNIVSQGGPMADNQGNNSGDYATGPPYGTPPGGTPMNGAAIFGNGSSAKHFILRIYTNANYNVLVGSDTPAQGTFNCVGPTTPPPPACPSNAALPATSPDCYCPVPGKTDLPKNSPQCFAPCQYNPAIPASVPECFSPCPYNGSIPVESNACKPCDKSNNSQDSIACVVLHKTASNITAGLSDANNTTAQAGDVITYTLYAQNTGKATIKQFIFQEGLSDVLDYATVADLHGGSMDATKLVSWPAQEIAAGQTATVQVTVKVLSPIPETPTGTSDPGHFDLIMTNVYGNAVSIKLPPSPAKTIELAAASLPNTGPGTSLFIGALIVIISSYFYSRARLLTRESNLAIHEMANA